MKKAFSFLIGIFVGAIVGGVFGFLFAPESGASMREKLVGQSSGFVGEIKTAIATRRAELEEQLAELRSPSRG